MTTYNPISGAPLQYSNDSNELASGYYLKFYNSDTLTPLSMATDTTGDTLLAYCKLSPSGMPISNPLDNDTDFIPHLSQSFRTVIYVNEADAIANTTANAFLNIANTPVPISLTNIAITIDSVQDIEGLTGPDDSQMIMKGWHPNSDKGGGQFYFDAAQAKSGHNGGTIFSPTVPWTTTTADYLNGVGETDAGGTGCWVRVYDVLDVMMFSAVGDGVTDDTPSIQAAIDYCTDTIALYFSAPSVTYQVGQLIFHHSGRYFFDGTEGRFIPINYLTSNYTGSDAAFILDGENSRFGSASTVGYSPVFKKVILYRENQDGPCFYIRAIKHGSYKECGFHGGTESLDMDSGNNYTGYNDFYGCRFTSGVNNPGWAHKGANLNANGTAGVNENHFINCVFSENGTNLVLAASTGNNGHNVFQNCVFEQAQNLGVSIGKGVNNTEFVSCRNEQNTIRNHAAGGRSFVSEGENIRIIGGNYASTVLASNERIRDNAVDGITVIGDISATVSGPFVDGTTTNIKHKSSSIRSAGLPEFKIQGGNEKEVESTDVDIGTDIITTGTHGFIADDPVIYVEPETESGITGLVDGTTYYIIVASSSTIQLAATPSGAAINLTAAGSASTDDPNRFILADYDEILFDWFRRSCRLRINGSNWLGFPISEDVLGFGKPIVFSVAGSFAPGIYFGSGSPEGVQTARVGSTFHRDDGGAGTSFYVKESGTGNTGWVGK